MNFESLHTNIQLVEILTTQFLFSAEGAGAAQGAEKRQNTNAQLPVGLPNMVTKVVDHPAQLPGPLGSDTNGHNTAGHIDSYPPVGS